MPNEQAAVGIRFNLTGMDDTLIQIGRLHEALGSLGIIPSNPFNPGLTHQQPERGTTAADATLPATASSAPAPSASPSQQGPIGGGTFVINQANIIIQTASIIVQTGQVTVNGPGGQGALTPPGAGGGASVPPPPPPTNNTPPPPPSPNPAPHQPQVTRPHEQVVGASHAPGLARYTEAVTSGATSLDFYSWQQEQLSAFNAGGARGSYATFLNTGRGSPGFLNQMMGGAFQHIPGMENISEALRSGQPMGEALGGLGPLAGGLAAGYGLHLAGQMARAGMGPAIGMQAVSPEQQYAAMLGPLAGIPVIGAQFGMVADRAQALGNVRDQAATLGGLYGRDASQIERIAAQSGRGFGAMAFDWLSTLMPILDIGRSAMGDNPGRGIAGDIQGNPVGIPNLGGQDVTRVLTSMIRADPGMSTDQAAAMLRGVATNPAFGGRPGAIMAGGEAMAQLAARRAADPELAMRSVTGQAMSVEDVMAMASDAAAQGDLSTVRELNVQANAMGIVAPHRFETMQRMAAAVGVSRIEQQGAGLRLQHVMGEESRAAATMRGGAAMAGIISTEAAPLTGQIDAIDAQIAQVQKALSISPGDVSKQNQLQGLLNARQQAEDAMAALPFRSEQAGMSAQMGLAGAQLQRGQTALGELSAFGAMPGAAMEGAFGNIRAGMDARITSQRQHVDFLRRAGVGPEVLAQAQAELESMESQRRTQPLTEIETRERATSLVGQAQAAGAGAELGVARMTQFSGGATDRLHAEVRAGIQVQLDAATEALSELRRTPGVDRGLIARKQAEIAQLNAQLASDMVDQARTAAQDAMQRAGHEGRMVSPGIAAASALGIAPTPGQEGAEREGLENEARTAETEAAKARARGDQKAAMDWEETAAQKRAQIQVLPLTQINRRYAPALEVAGAQASMAGSALSIARQEGMGGADTLDIQRSQVTAAQQSLAIEGQKLAEMRASLPEGSAVVASQAARVEQARVGVETARTGLANVMIPENLQERLNQGAFVRNVLERTPGAAGNLPNVIRGQIGDVGEEIRLLSSRLASDGPTMTAEGRLHLRDEIRGKRLEQFDLFNEMSMGWENRIMSQAINAPGNFGLVANVLGSPLRAVTHGIVNPHFGSNRENLGDFLRFASIVGQPARPPGFMGPDFSDTDSVPGFGRLYPSSARSGPAGAVGAIPAGRGSPRGAVGASAPPVVIVQLQWPNGQQAGTFQVPVPSGTVSQGVQGGEIAELLNALPIGAPSYR